MSGYREFNLHTTISSSKDCGAEDRLQFTTIDLASWEEIDHKAGLCSGEVGLSISFVIDDNIHGPQFRKGNEEENWCKCSLHNYEIYKYTTERVDGKLTEVKKRTNTINISDCLTDTDEIRDLGNWLIEQANKIDEEKDRLESRSPETE